MNQLLDALTGAGIDILHVLAGIGFVALGLVALVLLAAVISAPFFGGAIAWRWLNTPRLVSYRVHPHETEHEKRLRIARAENLRLSAERASLDQEARRRATAELHELGEDDAAAYL